MRGTGYIIASILRNPRRTAAYLVGTVIAVGLLTSVLFFVVGAAHVLTQRSIAGVRPDMQVVATSPASSVDALKHDLQHQPGIVAAQRFALAGFTSSERRSGNSVGQTGAGRIVAIDPSYFSTFGVPVVRSGNFRSSGIVISQDLGTNLGARVGDTITLSLGSGIPPQQERVTGVASMLNTDTLFAPLDPIKRALPFNPPANVVLIDYRRFEAILKPLLLRAGGGTSGGLVVRSKARVSEQVHLRLNRALVPADPSSARVYTTGIRNRLSLVETGRAEVIDNVAAALDTAQADVLWAQIIFVFLALPGVILAAALSRYVTAAAIDAQRRELALLRVRGIGPRRLLSLLGSTLLIVAMVGVLVGLAIGWISTGIASGTASMPSGPLLWRTVLLGIVAGLVLGALGTFWPLVAFVRAPIVDAQRQVGRGRSPLWSRLYLDVIALIVGVAIYLLTQRNGFQPVLNAEGNPTISLSFFTFLAPLLFWFGAILILVRVSGWLVQRSGALVGSRLRSGTVTQLAARTLSRRTGSLHQAVVLVAMAVAFSVGLATFVHTYDRQQRVDAALTLGSDVKVTIGNPAQSAAVARHLNVPGVTSYTPFTSDVAYVGTEIQDIFGIDVRSFTRTTHVTDSFFVGDTASATLDRLRTIPNGILVSAETARDYSLNRGDTLRLRILNRHTGRYAPVLFRLEGVVREFATAPKDAFLVVNLAYLQGATGNTGVGSYLVQAGDPAAVASRLRRQFAAGPVVQVQDLSSVQQQLATSLTSLDLTALSRIDYFFTLIMVLTGLVVFALAVILERGRDFAMLEVMGITPRQITQLLAFEIGYTALAGSILGLLVGLCFGQMLIQILTSIFDPPPDALIIPWNSVGGIAALVVTGAVIAGAVATVRLRRANLAGVLRET